MARANIDYVYLDMEHGPMNCEGLHRFTVGMIDKATILKKGSLKALTNRIDVVARDFHNGFELKHQNE